MSWPREVGCVLYEPAGGRRAIIVDPLAPAEQAERFWRWADERCRGREVVLLETIPFHRRDRDAFARRYAAGSQPPDAVVARPLAAGDETLYWLPEHRALIPGDSLVAIGGELSLCPASWLEHVAGRPTLAQLAAELRELLLGLDVELVLVSHGEPATSGAREALVRALAAA